MATPTMVEGEQVGAGLVTRKILEGWDIEFMRFQIPNVVSCKIVSGIQRTHVGA